MRRLIVTVTDVGETWLVEVEIDGDIEPTDPDVCEMLGKVQSVVAMMHNDAHVRQDLDRAAELMSTITKGTIWRRKVQLFLEAIGYATTARPWMEYGDDITATRGMLALSVECKDHRKLDLAGWVDQAERQAPQDAIPVVVAHRLGKAAAEDAYVIMSGRAFADLLESL